MTVRMPTTAAQPLLRVVRRTQPATRYAVAVWAVLSAAYLAWSPTVPDLAAQVARAQLVHQVGLTAWWPGWFGGTTLPVKLAPKALIAREVLTRRGCDSVPEASRRFQCRTMPAWLKVNEVKTPMM